MNINYKRLYLTTVIFFLFLPSVTSAEEINLEVVGNTGEFDGNNMLVSDIITCESNSITSEDFTVVHFADIHMGMPQRLDVSEETQDEKRECFAEAILAANQLDPSHSLILVTGDLVEYNEEEYFDDFWNGIFSINNCTERVLCVPGNHDRRTKAIIDSNGNIIDDLEEYNERIEPLLPERKNYLSDDFNDYSIEIGDYMFIGLDSLSDYDAYYWAWGQSFDITPESSGLHDTQIDALKELDRNKPKIIFMHHPAIQCTSVDDVNPDSTGVPRSEPGGNDGCIAFNRAEFIDYCEDYNVKLVIAGHTHQSNIIDSAGTPFFANEFPLNEFPLFVQTQSLTKHSEFFEPGYRTIEFKEGNIFIQLPVELTLERPDMISGSLNCPADLSAYDSEGRHTGPSSGKTERNIPDSFYFNNYTVNLYDNTIYNAPETILLYNTGEEYVFEIRANFSENELNSVEEQHFNFTLKQRSDSGTTEIVYELVPLTKNTVATIPITLTTQKYEMMIDMDGDGTIDETREPDSIQNIISGSKTVTNLQYTNGTAWINWTWTNPSDPDFNHTEIYLNNIFQTNTSGEFFNATNLEPETDYTIGTRTVDIYGNVNETWVNSTATTLKAPIAVEAGSDQTVEEGAIVNFEGSFTASGPHTYSYHWDFGDGSAEDSSLTTSHTYADDGVYTVNLTVTNEEGDFGNDTLLVTVNNAIPVIDSGSDLEVTAGDPVSFKGNFSDSGWLDTHTAEWNFGEGTVEAGSVSEENEYPDSTGTVSGSFSYFEAGEYTVTLNVADDDGGIGQDQLTVTVRPIEAEVTFDPKTFNLNSTGDWVTAYIELPAGYSVSGIDIGSVLLNGTVHAVSDPNYDFVTNESEYLTDLDLDGIPERMFKFNRGEVAGILKAGDQVTVTFTGKV
ncbi:MAG TPA: PKD domain-containing protein, partial [Chitinispirillaceae bacterium]|nr:PKD domain-containing protein [Chitinispirillaceae bacterium]